MRLLIRRLTLALAALLLVAGVWTAVALLQARGDLLAARADLQAATEADSLPEVRAQVAEAEDRLSSAARALHRPGPFVIARLPLVGRSVTAVTAAADASLAVVAAGEDVLQATPDDLVRGGAVDLEGLLAVAAATERAADSTRRPVQRLDDVELGLVPGVLAERVREVRSRLRDAPDALARATSAARGIGHVLGGDGDRRVLMMLQNNAELRGTGGLVTVFAEARAAGGRLEVQAFKDVEDVADVRDEVTRVPAPADYRGLWGSFLADSTLWLNTNMTPDVPTASAVLADVAVASGLRRPDAVVWFDVRAIAGLLEATGPVRLPDGTELTADNAIRVLLSEAYAGVDDTREGQAARRAALRAAADAVLGGLLDDSDTAAGVPALGAALGEAVDGRHLAVWADADAAQADLVAGGVAGDVLAGGGDLAAFTVQNFGGADGEGNKLDYYARRQVTVDVVVERDSALVEQRITLRNTAPGAGLPRYVAGNVVPGTSRSYVTMTLPPGAQVLGFRRGMQALSTRQRPQGDHAVLTDGATLAPGAETSWLLSYRIPVSDGAYALRVVPQPLAVDAGLRVEIRAAPGLDLRGAGVTGDRVVVSGPLVGDVLLEVSAQRANALRRAAAAVRRFWNEPVRLP